MKTNPPFPAGARADESDASLRTIIKLNVQVLGITFGILGGLGLFLATNILVIKGGPDVGAHLQLLRQFYYGYTVTYFGSLIGAVYGFLTGYVAGAVIAAVYNWVDYMRSR